MEQCSILRVAVLGAVLIAPVPASAGVFVPLDQEIRNVQQHVATFNVPLRTGFASEHFQLGLEDDPEADVEIIAEMLPGGGQLEFVLTNVPGRFGGIDVSVGGMPSGVVVSSGAFSEDGLVDLFVSATIAEGSAANGIVDVRAIVTPLPAAAPMLAGALGLLTWLRTRRAGRF